MAQQVQIDFVDDLNGKTITDTGTPLVTFSLDGTDYEIDLAEKNQQKLRKALAPYIDKARKVSAKTRRRSSAKSQSGSPASEIREWARSNGYDVPDRGRIPADIRTAFDNR